MCGILSALLANCAATTCVNLQAMLRSTQPAKPLESFMPFPPYNFSKVAFSVELKTSYILAKLTYSSANELTLGYLQCIMLTVLFSWCN